MYGYQMPIQTKVQQSEPADTLVMVGRRIRAIREISGKTQVELAALLNVAQTTYSKWETGRRMPDVLVLKEFARRFQASLDFFFSGSTEGLHPQLAYYLRLSSPDLLSSQPTNTAEDRDKALASYRAAIAAEMVD